jgi:thiol:disulfide interchange protein
MPVNEGSQRRFPAILIAVLVAAGLYRAASIFHKPNGGAASVSLVRWQNLDQAASLAAGQRKRILYDFNAEWCGPCHAMAEEVFDDTGSARYINDNLIPVSVVDRGMEDGKNAPAVEALQKKYAISAFPTLVLADAEGTQLGKLEGYPGKAAVMEFLKKP